VPRGCRRENQKTNGRYFRRVGRAGHGVISCGHDIAGPS